MLRLDDLDPSMSGNKVFKLLPNIHEVQVSGKCGIVTFGGPYSNHIHATAAAGQIFQIPTVGMVRVDPPLLDNPTLSDAKAWGMQVIPVNRSNYRRRNDADFISELSSQFPDYLVIPEGGCNALAEQGCRQLGEYVADLPYEEIFLACGSGTTAAGIAAGIAKHQRVNAVAVLKQFKNQQAQLLNQNIRCWTNFHQGGYAVLSSELATFIKRFEDVNRLQLDPVYTAKMALAVTHLVAAAKIDPDQCLLIHTGGLQGRRGMQTQLEALWRNNPPCT